MRFGLAILLRRPSRAAHRDPVNLDDIPRIRMPVPGILEPAARITLAIECLRIALLLVRAMLLPTPEPASQHDGNLPHPSLH